jgi:peptidoglycan/LPS O-acetylase OafA/YrhL
MMSISIADGLLPDGSGLGHAGLRIIAALGITVAISAASYAFLEKPFLSLKRRFTYVQSRPV